MKNGMDRRTILKGYSTVGSRMLRGTGIKPRGNAQRFVQPYYGQMMSWNRCFDKNYPESGRPEYILDKQGDRIIDYDFLNGNGSIR